MFRDRGFVPTLCAAVAVALPIAAAAQVRLGSEFQVNTYTTGYQGAPALALDADGDFVVVWQSAGQDGYGDGVFGQRFSSAGAALATEFEVGLYTSGLDRSPSVSADADGNFVVAWHDAAAGIKDVLALRFSSTGIPLGAKFVVNTYLAGSQYRPSVASAAGGDFVVAWDSGLQDGSGDSIFAQRFAGNVVLDVDGNGSVGALTDGLLVLRYFFGFTGTTLTTGAVDLGGCSRCNAAAIEPYIAGLAT